MINCLDCLWYHEHFYDATPGCDVKTEGVDPNDPEASRSFEPLGPDERVEALRRSIAALRAHAVGLQAQRSKLKRRLLGTDREITEMEDHLDATVLCNHARDVIETMKKAT